MLLRINFYHIFACFLFAILCLIVSVLMVNLASPAQQYMLDSSDIDITQSFAVLPEPTRLDKVVAHSQEIFQTGSWEQVPWRFGNQEYWLKLNIKNHSNNARALVLRFDNPMLDKLTIYRFNHTNTLEEIKHLGDLQTDLSRLEYAMPHYNLLLSGSESQKILVAIHTSGISKTPLTIHELGAFEQLNRNAFSLWGVFVGVLLMTAVYNLILYFSIRDRVYLVYVGYILSVMILLGIVLGYGFYLWPIHWQLYFHHQVIISNYAIAITTIGFCIMFLRYHKDKDSAYRIAVRYLQLLIILCFISIFIPENYAAPLFFTTMPGLYIICFWLIYKKLKSGFRWAKFYILSWLPLVCSAAVQPLELTGVLQYSYLTRHAFLFGSLLEIALMALALADRVRYQRKQALYHATHNNDSGLLNYTTLSQRVESLQKRNRPFSIGIIYMRSFGGLQSVLNVEQSNNLLRNVANNLADNVDELNCFNVVHHSDEKIVELSGGCLAFIFPYHARSVINQKLLHLLARLDTQFEIDTLTLHAEYQMAVIESLSPDHSVKQLVEQACHNLQKSTMLHSSVQYLDHNEEPKPNQLALAAKLQQAMNKGELRIFYQPQVDLDTLQVSGAEALLRWPEQQHRHFTVENIIQLAEQVGLINDLTLWVINTVCQDIAAQGDAWRSHSVSVNISAKDIHIDDFAQKLADMLSYHDIAPSQIKLELTESALVDDIQALKALIARLAELGVRVVLDDYGTGYSSLEYVLEYAFCELKIDKHFVLSMAQSTHHQAIVRTTINMAHNLGLLVTAEGVETQEVAALLREYRADKGQGYLFAKPMPLNDYQHWLAHHRSQH